MVLLIQTSMQIDWTGSYTKRDRSDYLLSKEDKDYKPMIEIANVTNLSLEKHFNFLKLENVHLECLCLRYFSLCSTIR